MPQLSRIVSDFPDNLRERFARNLPAAARELDKAAAQVLGVKGTPTARSRPGEPPREQGGDLAKLTHAVMSPKDLSVAIVTSQIGQWLNRGTRHIAPRPFAAKILRLGLPGFRRELHRK